MKNTDKKPKAQNKKTDLPDSVNEKTISYLQNKTAITEKRIIIFLTVMLVLLIGFIAADKFFNIIPHADYSLNRNSLNSKYLDAKEGFEDTSPGSTAEDSVTSSGAYDYGKSIICWGDSFSDNSANATTFFTYHLSEKLTNIGADVNSVIASGLEGDKIQVTAGKQGSIPMMVQPFKIPASVSPVEIRLKSYLDNEDILLQDKTNSGLNPCTIAGIDGSIEYSGGKLCFKRSQPGKEINVSTPTAVVTNAMANIKDYTGIYFFGGDCTGHTPEELTEIYRDMIKLNGKDKYIIIGSVTGDEETLAPYEQALMSEFKSHYINLREYLTSDVYNQYSIEINSNDAKALRSGSVPPSFISNGKRLSEKGNEILAELIYEKLQQLDLI